MTKDKIRTIIAEFCGWTIEDTGNGKMWHLDGILSEDAPPLYCDDLNAMYEAEMKLKQLYSGKSIRNLWRSYYIMIWKVVNPDIEFKWESQHWVNCIHANCLQRAEAFVRAINKWENDDLTKG